MGNKKISDLTPASSVSNSDQLVVSQGAGAGQTRSSTFAVLKTWILTWIKGLPDPVALPYSAGATLPIVLTSFQTSYSVFGSYPKFEVMINNGADQGLDITSQSSVNKGTAIPPNTITINTNDNGSGVTTDDILIIIKP